MTRRFASISSVLSVFIPRRSSGETKSKQENKPGKGKETNKQTTKRTHKLNNRPAKKQQQKTDKQRNYGSTRNSRGLAV